MFQRVAPTLPRADGVRRVIVPRRLFEKNGVEYFIRALPLIRRSLPVEALIVGDGPDRSAMEKAARDFRLTVEGENTRMPLAATRCSERSQADLTN